MLAFVFFIAAAIDITLVRALAVQIGVAVSFNYILQIFSLSAAAVIDSQREKVSLPLTSLHLLACFGRWLYLWMGIADIARYYLGWLRGRVLLRSSLQSLSR